MADAKTRRDKAPAVVKAANAGLLDANKRLDVAKEVIRDLLYQKQFQEQYGIWLERLKAKTYIDIRL